MKSEFENRSFIGLEWVCNTFSDFVCLYVQAHQKLQEEKRRAERYLETSKESQSLKLV